MVADGLDGKLAVMGPMADLYRLACWFHRRGFQSGMVMFMETTEGLKDVAMPPGVPGPGGETCLAVQPPDSGDVSVLLVERNNIEAGTRSYTLRTVHRQFIRMASFLFADVITPDEALRVRVDQQFRFGQKSLKIENEFVRNEGEDAAIGRVTMNATKPKNREPRYIKITQSQLIDLMTSRFVASAGRTSNAAVSTGRSAASASATRGGSRRRQARVREMAVTLSPAQPASSASPPGLRATR